MLNYYANENYVLILTGNLLLLYLWLFEKLGSGISGVQFVIATVLQM